MESGWRNELEAWLSPFAAALRNKTRRRMCPAYIAGLIGPGVLCVPAGMTRSRHRSSVSTRPVTASTARARSGISCSAMVLLSPGAPWNA